MPRLPTKLDHETASLPPGGTAGSTLLVYNPAEEADEVVVDVQGPLAEWVHMSPPPPLVLPPRTEGRVDVAVTLPTDAPITAGVHPILLEARSALPDVEPSIQELDVEVLPHAAGSLALRRAGGQDGAVVYEAEVASASNHPLHLVVEVDASVDAVVDPPTLEVAPFASASTSVTLHPPADEPGPVPFTVRATGDGLDLASRATWRSRPSPVGWPPSWRLVAAVAVAAIALVTLLIVGWDGDGPPELAVTHQVPVGPRPSEVEFAFGFVWVTHADGALLRIDPAEAATVGSPIDVGARAGNLSPSPTGDALWITDPVTERVVRVDPQGAGGPVVNDEVAVQGEVVDLVAGDGALWLSLLGEGEILRLGPDGVPVEWFTEMGGAADVAFADGSVWATDADGRLVRLDPAALPALQASIPVDGHPVAVLGAFGDVWATVTVNEEPGTGDDEDPAQVVRVDAEDDEVVATIATSGRPWGLAEGDGLVWAVGRGVTDEDRDGWVAVIDPDENAVVDQLPLGFALDGVAFDGEALWVADVEADRVYRIEAERG